MTCGFAGMKPFFFSPLNFLPISHPDCAEGNVMFNMPWSEMSCFSFDTGRRGRRRRPPSSSSSLRERVREPRRGKRGKEEDDVPRAAPLLCPPHPPCDGHSPVLWASWVTALVTLCLRLSRPVIWDVPKWQTFSWSVSQGPKIRWLRRE